MSAEGNESWSLVKDGILWKKVTNPEHRIPHDQATRFVQQLEASIGPVNFLGGLLLDRIAANCLRQQALLDIQREVAPDLAIIQPYQNSVERATNNVGSPWFVNLLKYENLLNQAFHRDLILLQTLQQAGSIARVPSPKKPPQSDRSLVEGQADLLFANEAVRPSAAIDSDVTGVNEVKRGEEDQREKVRIKEDPDRPGYIEFS